MSIITKYVNEIRRQKRLMVKFAIATVVLSVAVAGITIWNLRLEGEAATDTEVHVHSEECMVRELTCDLQESIAHKHTLNCYQKELTCGLEEHQHGQSCMEQVLCCDVTDENHSHSEDCYEQRLTCEQTVHAHSNACYDYPYICGLTAHVHSDACYGEELKCQDETSIRYTTDPNHEHSDACRLCCELEEHDHDLSCLTGAPLFCGVAESTGHTHDDSCYHITYLCTQAEAAVQSLRPVQQAEMQSDTPAPLSDDLPETVEIPVAGGKIKIRLLYNDARSFSQRPEGQSGRVQESMYGYLDIAYDGIPGSAPLPEYTVRIRVPKTYEDLHLFELQRFSADLLAHDEAVVTEEGDYDQISIRMYPSTQNALRINFKSVFKDSTVPATYELPVELLVDCNGTTYAAEPLIFKPEYEQGSLTKYVNTNRIHSMSEDSREPPTVTTIPYQNADGQWVSDSSIYTNFYFDIYNDIIGYTVKYEFRDIDRGVLTDYLPWYETVDGQRVQAAFDQAANPDWHLETDENGEQYVWKEILPGDGRFGLRRDIVLGVAQQTVLKLRFPNLKLEHTYPYSDGTIYYYEDLTNHATFCGHPTGKAEDEEEIWFEDDLTFRLTSKPGAEGSLSKVKTGTQTYYDTADFRNVVQTWKVALRNNADSMGFRNVSIYDTYEGYTRYGVAYSGLDPRLKLTEFTFDKGSILPPGETDIRELVQEVRALGYDGTEDVYAAPDCFDENLRCRFPANKEYKQFEIVMKDDYVMGMGEEILFDVYTELRDKSSFHVDFDDLDSSRFDNVAKATYVNYLGTTVFLTSADFFEVKQASEDLVINKNANSSGLYTQYGPPYIYWSMSIRGLNNAAKVSFDDTKSYDDLRVIELLPEGMTIQHTNGAVRFAADDQAYIFKGACFDTTAKGEPVYQNGVLGSIRQDPSFHADIIENYQNTGRTAVILPVDVEHCKQLIAAGKVGNGLFFTVFFYVDETKLEARNINDVYLVGSDLTPILNGSNTARYVVDENDMDQDGDTTEYIRHSSGVFTYKMPQAVTLRKAIAPKGSNAWRTETLNMKLGDEFQYRLRIYNGMPVTQESFKVFESLPRVGDADTNGGARNTEFDVFLTGEPTGSLIQTIHYYTDPAVVGKTFEQVQNGSYASYEGIEGLTAAGKTLDDVVAMLFDCAGLENGASSDIFLPVRTMNELGIDQQLTLEAKQFENAQSGLVAYLEATNNFGYQTNGASERTASNHVKARIAFAGFALKKVDRADGNPLAGATFRLSGNGITPREKITGNDGIIAFTNLAPGSYALTETEAPNGYVREERAYDVTVTQDLNTFAYTITITDPDGNAVSCAANYDDPLIVGNLYAPELPSTGGIGIWVYVLSGMMLMALAAILKLRLSRV